MSADLAAFVDSSVLVYAVSNDEPSKQSSGAREIVARGFTEGGFAAVELPAATRDCLRYTSLLPVRLGPN